MSVALVVGGGRELGWDPTRRDVETLLDLACRWHRTHPKGYSSAE